LHVWLVVLYQSIRGYGASVDEKSEKSQLFPYCSGQNGFPMRASDSSVGGNAGWVAKIQVGGNRAPIAARLKP
jgi:hypothetical protein